MFEYANGIDYIKNFTRSGKPVKDLHRIALLLESLGNPQDKLKFVHIAGTNGKGSMAKMFSCIFSLAGLKTGLFTSPFMLRYNDRIQIDGEDIPDEILDRLGLEVKKAVDKLEEKDDFSQFEITTAVAFLYFLEQKCDIVVLETGMGGLLDCTNVVTTSVLTVIGSVDFDHTAILGDTLEKIARQKAGIIKPHTPCVLSAGNKMEVIRVVREKAIENLAQLVIPNISLLRLYRCDCFGADFDYKGKRYSTSMGGAHQVLNALSVIEGVNLINDRLKIPYEKISEGIKKAILTGRAEVISEKPLTILDGAHNPDGLEALAGVISHCDKTPCRAIIGMCSDKNITDGIKKIIPYVESFITVDDFSPRAENKEKLCETIRSCGGNARPSEIVLSEEIKQMQSQNQNGLNLICGSLFLVAKVKNGQ